MILKRNSPAPQYARIMLIAWMVVVFLFLFVPIVVIVIYSFNGGRNLYVWTEWSTRWYAAAIDNPRVLNALRVSVQTAVGSAI